MKKKNSFALSPVGAASLLSIFAVLCLVVFALLAMSTASANQRLSDSTAESVAAYYEADCRAEKTLSKLRAGEMPEGVTLENGIYSYSHPVTDTQTLEVELKLDGEDYTVLRWQLKPTGDWKADDSMPVWDGKQE